MTTAHKSTRPSNDQIRSMCADMGPDLTADLLNIPLPEIVQIQGVLRGKWMLRNNRTGQTWTCWSERSCYLQAQIMGLVDYDFGRAQ